MKHLRLLPILLSLGVSVLARTAAAAEPAAPSPARPHYTLENCINTFDPAKTEKTDAGYQYWFADYALAGGKTVKMSVVGPHLATHAPHHHPEDEFFFILAGTAEVYLDGQWRAVGPNTCFYCPSGHEHGIRNAGDTELRYLVIKKYETPPPAAATPAK
ncbi:MAG TPA: cupin domain-containing protein [Opitutaceae bacterium]|nr:cupin domain-containing protein [Opitutaceae bacterium]